MKLTLGTRNANKVRELGAMLADLGVTVAPLPEGIPECDEDTDTFVGNATKKALEYAAAVGGWVLADDSGLCVDALDGAPGVHSAYYAGTHGDHAGNNAKLLAALKGVSEDARSARFRCILVLARPGEVALQVEGRVEGRIAAALRGEGGFGYDPLFELTEDSALRGKTLAELRPEEKNLVSHRGRALEALKPQLAEILARA